MELHQSVSIPVGRGPVWQALNDPAVLQQCLPGCESFVAKDNTAFEFVIAAKVGPVKTRFAGDVSLSNIVPPTSYTISGSGKGGVAGFGKGHADVVLTDTGTGTILSYTVNVSVGGKLAQIGSRLVAAAARKMADEFFRAFAEQIGNGMATAGEAVAGSQLVDDKRKGDKLEGQALGPGFWIAGLIAIVAVLWWLSS